MACSRIFAFIFSLRESTVTRTPAAFSWVATFCAYSTWRSAIGIIATCTAKARRGTLRVVFDQYTKKRSTDRRGAVDHERLLAGAIFGDVFEIEALRQVEVELDGGELPQASDGVHQFHIDLGTVKRSFAGMVLYSMFSFFSALSNE